MNFYINLGYQFKIPSTVKPEGSVLLSSSMPMHQLTRRKFSKKYPHLENRIFDPQLYLAGLDANESPSHCTKLGTYPWFGINHKMQKYKSGEQKQKEWKDHAETNIRNIWTCEAPSDWSNIRSAVGMAIEFQNDIGCEAIILPSPLTVDASSDYSDELMWLDQGLEIVKGKDNLDKPIFATVALSDLCTRHTDPPNNNLLAIILDSISARKIDGVYLVLEQSSASSELRHCGDTRSLWSMLYLTHIFARESNISITVNFLGQFGLACIAAGADVWASGWYKSIYRLRIADRLGGGRAYPSYWSYSTATDIHLDKDFDALNEAGVLNGVLDETDAAEGLHRAAERGISVNVVPRWRYAMSNVALAKEHYLLSSINSNGLQNQYSNKARHDFVEHWLRNAAEFWKKGSPGKSAIRNTKTNHVYAWLSAYRNYRRFHKV